MTTEFARPLRVLLLLAAGAVALAAPAGAQLSSEGGPIRVNADNSSVYERQRRVLVVGNVDIIQGEARLRADKVTLTYSGTPETGGTGQSGVGRGFGAIETMTADGNVFYITPDLKARGDRGTYAAASDTITMTGDVVLIRGEDVARGCELVLEVTAGRSTLRGCGEDGRVQMLIVPDGEEGADRPEGPETGADAGSAPGPAETAAESPGPAADAPGAAPVEGGAEAAPESP